MIIEDSHSAFSIIYDNRRSVERDTHSSNQSIQKTEEIQKFLFYKKVDNKKVICYLLKVIYYLFSKESSSI